MHVEPVDLTDRAATVAAGAAVRTALGGLDVAVLDAGTWSQFRVEKWDSAAFAENLQVNVMGTVHSLEAVVPAMLADGRGRIVGMASVAGYRGLPGGEAYGSSKAALLHLFETPRGSLAPHGIVVQTLSPGFVRTPLTERNRFPMPFLIDPEEAATAIVDGIAKDKAEVVFPLPMMLLMTTARAGAGPAVDGADRTAGPAHRPPVGLESSAQSTTRQGSASALRVRETADPRT